MSNPRVNIAYFFEQVDRFPWDLFGWTQPLSGPVHAYMCDFGSHFCEPTEWPMLIGRPTYSELKKLAHDHEGIFKRIIQNCRDQDTIQGRIAKSEAVIAWLFMEENFIKMMQKRMDRLYVQGLIQVPEAARNKYETI